MQGEIIKDFELVRRLGKGGMGEVWLAQQKLVKTHVAVKLMNDAVSADSAQVERFFDEARAVSRIHHAGIVKIFDVGFHAGRAYLIAEFLDGETLASRIRRLERMPLPQVLELGRQIAGVLEATRAAGITHRDLKPENVFVVPDAELPGGERAKLVDFGIAKLAGRATPLTGANDSMGTPAYMAPELWREAARADARADTYAFGCIVFEMCCGRVPFVCETVAGYCACHLNDEAPRVSSIVPVPARLDDIVARMLAKEPGERPHITELRACFDALARGADVGSATTLGSVAGQVEVPPRRSRAGVAIAAGVLAAAGGIAVYAATRPSGTSEPPRETVVGPPPSVDAPPPTKLREPAVGLAALEAFRDPTPRKLADLRSMAMWEVARDDLADACKQPGAPVRWCAGAELATGQALLAEAKLDAAIAELRKAAEHDPTWALPHVALADALPAAGGPDAVAHALEHARTAQRLDSSWQSIAAAARAYTSAGKLDDAIQEYRRALALAPKNAVLLSEVALAYHVANLDSEAARYGDEALAVDDDLVNVHVMRAELALEKGDAKAALAESERGISISPKNVSAHLARADALVLRGNHDVARAEYAKALELRADHHVGAPVARMELVEKALATGRLPPPRHPIAASSGESPERTQPVAPNRPAPPGPARSTPTSPNGGKPRPTHRSGPSCSPGDPTCDSDL